jgi:hypothetical protein
MTFGRSAHAQADPIATFSEKIFLATRKTGMQVRAEQRLLNASSAMADAVE